MPRSRRHYRVTLAEAFIAHDSALKFGGLPGVRDQGLIEAALARPYSGYYKAIEAKAAALVHSLAMNHGFIDGNKRTSLLMVLLFLRKSGYKLVHNHRRIRDREIEEMILSVVEHRMTFEKLIMWFHERIERI